MSRSTDSRIDRLVPRQGVAAGAFRDGECHPDRRRGQPAPVALAKRSSSVVVTGYVDDFDEIYRSASLFVAPVTLGAGIKFKVLDAMAYGLAVVATPIAAEGIVEEAGCDCFAGITADPDQMAERIVFSLRRPDYRSAVGTHARSWVHSRFNFERSVSRSLQIYQRLCSASRLGEAGGISCSRWVSSRRDVHAPRERLTAPPGFGGLPTQSQPSRCRRPVQRRVTCEVRPNRAHDERPSLGTP